MRVGGVWSIEREAAAVCEINCDSAFEIFDALTFGFSLMGYIGETLTLMG